MTISATKTVRELALEVPSATRLFEKLGIDYCCGGGKSLTDACAVAGLAVEAVLSSLDQSAQCAGDFAIKDWKTEPLSALISHILDKHHAFTREELDRLGPLLAKVVRVYGEAHSELSRVQALFHELKRELLAHMLKEEQVLFPYILQMEEAANDRRSRPAPFFGTVQNPVRMMMTEHDAAGEMLRGLRALTNNFTAPADACVSFKTLYGALEELERDLHEHIHLENNLLFPRAVGMERER